MLGKGVADAISAGIPRSANRPGAACRRWRSRAGEAASTGSGGRTRALVRNRPVLLLDEAFASLGPALRHEMLDLIGQLHTDTRMTVVMVTHHPEDALRLPSTLFFLENGRVAASGPARELLSATGPALLRKYLGSQELSL